MSYKTICSNNQVNLEALLREQSLNWRSSGPGGEELWQWIVLSIGIGLISVSIISYVKKWNSKYFYLLFFISFCIGCFISRVPLLTAGYFHPDEAEWLAYANTLIKDPYFWFTDAYSTTRILTVTPLVLFKIFGFNMSFVLGKFAALVGWLIISGQLLLLYRKHYSDYTVLFLTPIMLTQLHWILFSNITYNSEIPGISLMLIVVTIIVNNLKNNLLTTTRMTFWCSIIISLLPLVKLNFALFSIILYIYFFYYSKNKTEAIKTMLKAWSSVWVTYTLYLLVTGEIKVFYGFILSHLGYATAGHSPIYNLSKERTIFVNIWDTIIFITSIIDFKPFVLSFTCLLIFFVSFQVKNKIPLFKNKRIILAICLFIGSFLTALVPQDKLLNHAILYYFFIYFTVTVLCGEILRKKNIKRSKYLVLGIYLVGGFLPFFYSLKNGNIAFISKEEILLSINVAKEIENLTSNSEKIVTWGLGNDLYVASKRIQGSRYLNYWAILSGLAGHEIQRDVFVRDIIERKPKLFIDCVHEKNWAWWDKNVSSFENFPLIKDIIHKNYTFHKKIDGYRIYLRKKVIII